ncbi:MAG TPA: HAMP domain-containing protein [Myxococcaceae bacterium]|nr:HAMP domain-containing protein [Myxococcaceae bacterium]
MATTRTATPMNPRTPGRQQRGRPSRRREPLLEALLAALQAAARGDFSTRLSAHGASTYASLARAFNELADVRESFGRELARVARLVGQDGRVEHRASLGAASGAWASDLEALNSLVDDLVQPTAEIARVIDAVATGDLDVKMAREIDGRPVKGEFLRIGTTVNAMVEQLRRFAEEVTRVTRAVGVEGKLGGQAQVAAAAGAWRDLVDNVNLLAHNLTSQVRDIAEITTAVATGDLSKKITVAASGEVNQLKDTINTMVDQLRSFAAEVTRVAKEVGTEGKLGGEAVVPGVSGTWKDLTENVNGLAANLTSQVRNIAKVTTAVANGDLSQKITVEARGEVLELKDTINTMVDQLRAFAAEVTRVAREVGVEGALGGQARVPGVAGTWRDLTDNVNFMARNLTTQVRGIVRVVTAVATGDLRQKLVGVEAKGEIAALAETINSMTDTLSLFADQVSTVAREVGIEGKLGGQAKVPGATGTWRQLTDNVNQLAQNLTTQVRAIANVATAVTKGDLTRSINVHAEGEVAALKDNLNQMIVNLKETTQKDAEQDWLKTNLARFSSMLQGQKDLQTVCRLIMSELTPLVSAQHGAFYLLEREGSEPMLMLRASYAFRERKGLQTRFRLGEGLIGQCALEKERILVANVPRDYMWIGSGLGEAAPLNVVVLPVLFEGEVKAVIELASFHPFGAVHLLFLEQLMQSIGVVLNVISANMRTEELLQQSQRLTQDLQFQSQELTEQQAKLKRTNAELERQAQELEEKARLLEEQNRQVEEKNREVEQGRAHLEEKAEQLALVSRYKSEFLANMSHELRTPLNSLLVLAKLLANDREGRLPEKENEYARTILASGQELLALIEELLDLSKIEAGKMEVSPREVPLAELREFVERAFRPLAEEKGLAFTTHIDGSLPLAIHSDPQRLKQVLKNLLANAFKFTEAGSVALRVHRPGAGVVLREGVLDRAGGVVAFSVVDTGIGIPDEKQMLIFEAFQQADGSTSRRFGGTGLGLSISRELARLLSGEIQMESAPGRGSTFTLYLPESPAAVGSAMWGTTSISRAPEWTATPEPLVRTGASPEALPDPGTALSGARLLVVEDDVRNAFALASMLESHGAEVVHADGGQSALQRLSADPRFDAVLLDIMMPGMDGYETMAALQGDPTIAGLPVIAVTAKALPGDRERCLAAGASAYLAKPVEEDALVDAVRRLTQP